MSNRRNLLRSLRPKLVLFLIPGLKISIIIVLVGILLFSLMLWHYLNTKTKAENFSALYRPKNEKKKNLKSF